jgi:hypothetical protein
VQPNESAAAGSLRRVDDEIGHDLLKTRRICVPEHRRLGQFRDESATNLLDGRL